MGKRHRSKGYSICTNVGLCTNRGVSSIAKQAYMGRVAFLVLKRKERGSSGQVMRDRLADAG